MKRIVEMVREVYQYEKKIPIEKDYLRNILFLFAGIIFVLNLFANGRHNVGIYIFCIIICLFAVYIAIRINGFQNINRVIHAACGLLLLSSVYCLYFAGNHGFQNLWYFLFPCILIILIGLPMGIPYCVIYGACTTWYFWSGDCDHGVYQYSVDYRYFYPVFYWSFVLLIIFADIFYKQNRIQWEKGKAQMESEVAKTVGEAQKIMLNSVAAISRMIDEKDSYTREHSKRVAEYSRLIAQNMKGNSYTKKEFDEIYRSALLHDIGKIAIPDRILNKPDRLTDEEYDIMKSHTTWGKEILAELKFLPLADYGARYHHERYDGRGYPEGIKTGELPQLVRIISAADALDAMNSNRCYRKHCGKDYIIEEFQKGSGKQFDPEVADCVIRLIEEGILQIDGEFK